MTGRRVVVVVALLVIPLHARGQQRLPIIDMHLHAYAANENGPPPLGLCVPILPHLAPLDPGREVFRAVAKAPPCSHPIWSPLTDQGVMDQTIAVLERRNIIGVLSGSPERVRRWFGAAPRRFIPSVEFQLGPDALPRTPCVVCSKTARSPSWAKCRTNAWELDPTTSGWSRTGRLLKNSTYRWQFTWEKVQRAPATCFPSTAPD